MPDEVIIPATNRRRPDDALLITFWISIRLLEAVNEDKRRLAQGWAALEAERKRLMQQAATVALAKRQWRALLLWTLLMGMALMGALIVLATEFF